MIGGGSGCRKHTGGGNLERDICERWVMNCIDILYQQSLTLGCPPYCLRQLPGERPVAVVKAMRNEELWL